MTQNEAKKRWCPFVREEILPGKPFNGQPNCIASDCMAWRWRRFEPQERVEPHIYVDEFGNAADKNGDLLGHCGLAGKP